MVFREKRTFNDDSTLLCKTCNTNICVGTGGLANLEIHKKSKKCSKLAEKTKAEKEEEKKKGKHSLRSFFGPVQPKRLVAPTTRPPPKVIPTGPHHMLRDARPLQVQEKVLQHGQCVHTTELLERLQAAANRIPRSIALAGDDHPLAIFSADPKATVPIGLDCWEEILNPMMKQAFGWGSELSGDMMKWKWAAQRGPKGIDGFIEFIKFCVINCGLNGTLIEPKVTLLINAIANEYVSFHSPWLIN